MTIRGSEHIIAGLQPLVYSFKSDQTFIKYLDSFDWRDEGTWTYNENTGILTLTYKTYTTQVSDTKSLDLKIDRITDTRLIFKVDYGSTNIVGEVVEFDFVHYLKK